ncbi:unnamed protein product [Mycetohabitans rhizoxinica HKI 454]|uniref:Uncharacterized protein n=1 Tax=Mycetohabitans rhizoxinica (strain DSM 19002 / CIP 109453 / HKI 454) TaxID=882378 RepID=E5ANI4_MYCRK|nr:unnamed protein product [Mycetohabitans rhizoxinica HKI 454]
MPLHSRAGGHCPPLTKGRVFKARRIYLIFRIEAVRQRMPGRYVALKGIRRVVSLKSIDSMYDTVLPAK